jgi:hypothetical protein
LDKFLEEASKPYWWISVVAAGIVINLVSSYLKDGVDFIRGIARSWWIGKSEIRKAAWEARRAEREALISRLVADFQLYSTICHREMRCRVSYISLFLMGIFIMVLDGSIRRYALIHLHLIEPAIAELIDKVLVNIVLVMVFYGGFRSALSSLKIGSILRAVEIRMAERSDEEYR